MGRRPLPHAGWRDAHSRARHVRALLSHRLRREGGNLRGYVHGGDPMEECRSAIQQTFGRAGGTVRAVSPNKEVSMRALIPLLTTSVVLVSALANAQEFDWQKVDAVFDRKAVVTGDVYRYGFPRSDLSVTLDGVAVKPALALGGWIAFKPAHDGAMVMGDLVLLEPEINPVVTKLIEGGIEITAIRNLLPARWGVGRSDQDGDHYSGSAPCKQNTAFCTSRIRSCSRDRSADRSARSDSW